MNDARAKYERLYGLTGKELYEELKKELNGRETKKQHGVDTYLVVGFTTHHGASISLQYHYSTVATCYEDGTIEISHGRWNRSVTTKERINRFLWRVGWRLYQKDWLWYVQDDTGTSYDYQADMQIDNDDKVTYRFERIGVR